jgi:3-dehydroquinate dehydratase II
VRQVDLLMANTVFVLNGPNLNLLGTREPQTYGRATLRDVEMLCRETAKRHGLDVEFRQSNHEGSLIDWIQEAGAKKAAGVVLNAGGFTHTSVAIRDAIAAINAPAIEVPTIEVHVSNIHAREDFRHLSYISAVARGTLCGFGIFGYALAIDGLAAMANPKAKS